MLNVSFSLSKSISLVNGSYVCATAKINVFPQKANRLGPYLDVHQTATPSGASSLKSNSTRQEHTVGGGKRPIEHQTSIPLDGTGANNDSLEYNNASKKSKPSTSQPSAANDVKGPSPPPGLLVTGRDCIEIEIDSD